MSGGKHAKTRQNRHSFWQINPAPQRNCWRFLDSCVRQNSAELPKLRIIQHLKFVRHTAQECLGAEKVWGRGSRTARPGLEENCLPCEACAVPVRVQQRRRRRWHGHRSEALAALLPLLPAGTRKRRRRGVWSPAESQAAGGHGKSVSVSCLVLCRRLVSSARGRLQWLKRGCGKRSFAPKAFAAFAAACRMRHKRRKRRKRRLKRLRLRPRPCRAQLDEVSQGRAGGPGAAVAPLRRGRLRGLS